MAKKEVGKEKKDFPSHVLPHQPSHYQKAMMFEIVGCPVSTSFSVNR